MEQLNPYLGSHLNKILTKKASNCPNKTKSVYSLKLNPNKKFEQNRFTRSSMRSPEYSNAVSKEGYEKQESSMVATQTLLSTKKSSERYPYTGTI